MYYKVCTFTVVHGHHMLWVLIKYIVTLGECT